MDCHVLDPSTKAWIITAVGKLTSQIGQLQDGTKNVLEKQTSGVDVELRQVSKGAVRIHLSLPRFQFICLCL